MGCNTSTVCQYEKCTIKCFSPYKYCLSHGCWFKGCRNMIGMKGKYCLLHKCLVETCPEKKVIYRELDIQPALCHEHNCSYYGCISGRLSGAEVCKEHQCDIAGCNRKYLLKLPEKLCNEHYYKHRNRNKTRR